MVFGKRKGHGMSVIGPTPHEAVAHPIEVPHFARYVDTRSDDTWKLKLRIARERIANNIRQTEVDMGSTNHHPYDLGKLDAYGTAVRILSDMLGPDEEDE